MAGSRISIGETAVASKMNQILGMNSNVIAYDASGRISTLTDSETAEVYTFSYNEDDSIDTVTDGTDTWEFSYDSEGRCTGQTVTP